MTTPQSRGDRARAAAASSAREDLRDLVPRPPSTTSPLVPLALILTGSYLMWFAIHYWRDQVTTWPTDPVKDVLQGKGIPRPSPAPSIAATAAGTAQAAAGPAPAGSGGGSLAGQFGAADGDAIAKDAAAYAGKVKYTWGGSSPATGWDCSGLVNWVLCHDLGLDIPGIQGGHFDGKIHGPNVAEWLAWEGVDIISTPGPVASTGKIEPGDLIAWGPNQHIGIATGDGKMVSAENPASGTAIAEIAGFGFPAVLRLRAVAAMGTLKGNQAAGALIAGKYGWAPTQDAAQWAALVRLWTRESGWSVTATNPASGAYGIPQALPGDKMASAGQNWRTSATTQITWGLRYIHQTYGTPSNAWAHEQQLGWY